VEVFSSRKQIKRNTFKKKKKAKFNIIDRGRGDGQEEEEVF